jgi:mRNA interferase RelE/StbE
MASQYLRIPQHLVELIRGLHPEIKRKVKGSLQILMADPNAWKPLKDEFEKLRSLRVNRFRIIYRLAEPGSEIEIVAIGPRERIYDETYRLVRNETQEQQHSGWHKERPPANLNYNPPGH